MAKPRRKSTPSRKPAPQKAKAKPAPQKAKKPAKPQPSKKPAPAAKKKGAAPVQPSTRGGRTRPAAPARPPEPPRRSTYVDALAAYERGIQALQARKYKEAADILRSVIAQYPEEKELHERATLYIRFCERQIAAAPPPAETPEDRVYAATVAINNGAVDEAVSLLTAALAQDPENDHATYMLGVAYALKGDAAAALQHLARSMALNPENRDLARKEPDLEALRRTDEMRDMLASPPAPLPRKEKDPAPAKRKR